jgi:archaellum component FlaC
MSTYKALPGTGEVNLSHISKTLKEMSSLIKTLKICTSSTYDSTLQRIKVHEADLIDIFENGKPSKDQKAQFQSLSRQFEELKTILKDLEEAYARRTVRESIYASTGLVQYDELAYKNEEEIDRQLLQEKHEAAEEIHKDIVKLNEMFKDVAGMVNEQGQGLDRMDQNLEVAVKSTDQANKDLNSAKGHQLNARKKACYLTVFAIFIICLGLIWWFFPGLRRLLRQFLHF